MERDYILVTDDSCDLPPEYYVEHNVPLMYIHCNIDDKTYTSAELPPRQFYDLLRQGKMPTTAQVGVDEAIQFMEPFLKQGKDVLFMAFSSGLSGTCNSAMLAAQMLGEMYPDRRVVAVDSLCASLGQGLMLHKLIALRDAGSSMDELIAWVEENRLNIAHYVTVEDLMHLHRGGRVSKASAVVGGMLGIKPMIHVNNEGKLINIGKVRGRKQALEATVNMMAEVVGDTPNDTFFVSHSDCLEDAEYVAKLVSERFGIKDHLIHFIGPVIGSHTGIGTVALFMMAQRR